ncbi:MAG: LCP family protein [Clostridiales bacterium]|nr:LCP family protein [Clostridiales bacterium]
MDNLGKDNTFDKDNKFDIENDPEFNANFYKNIEKVLENIDMPEELPNPSIDILTEEEAAFNELQEEETEEAEEADEADMEAADKPLTSQNLEAAAAQADLAEESSIEDELMDISSMLAKQVSEELDTGAAESSKKQSIFLLQNSVLLSILCILGFCFFFAFTKPGNGILMKIGINIGAAIWETSTNNFTDVAYADKDIDYIDEEDLKSDAEEIDPETIDLPNYSGGGKKEKGVYNILVLGEEAIGQGAGRGRTDVIIIATINTNTKSLKLTSLMRDTLVKIPGYKENKLNVVYELGGIDLMYKTLAQNFDIHLDGSVLVNFKNFEKIIDELGGLEITLTAAEAKYLRTTNYISNPEYRTVVEGKQLMNGNQVLGYSRIRKRAAITGNNNDYGRTDRHRIILNAIFEKCKSKDKVELAGLMLKFLPMLTTDIDANGFETLLDAYLQTGATSIEQLRIPANGTFRDNIKVRGMSVLIPDYEVNTNMLHDFIFGNKNEQN